MFSKVRKLFGHKEEPQPLEDPTETVGLEDLDEAEKISDVFPGVRHLAANLSIRAQDNEIEPSLTNRSFGPQSRAYFLFRCKNVECVDGGFDLRDEIQQAVDENRTEANGRRLCQGWRNANMAGYQRCFYELNFKIHVSYKD